MISKIFSTKLHKKQSVNFMSTLPCSILLMRFTVYEMMEIVALRLRDKQRRKIQIVGLICGQIIPLEKDIYFGFHGIASGSLSKATGI